MEPWIAITVAAAFAQTLRFMAQKQLKLAGFSTGGATLARFIYAAPIAAVLLPLYASVQAIALPGIGPGFWVYGLTGGLAQILATLCTVALFSHRNFAVGITFKKTEVMLTAVVGFVVLGDRITALGGLALALGLVGVLWLSDPPGDGRGLRRFFNRAAGLGLLSGLFFAVSAVGYRGAVLALEGGDTALRAGMTLAIVTAAQTLALGAWLILREPGQVARILRGWRATAPVGALSMIGSFCWFAAFSLQNAAYVFAVGQVEVIFSMIAATLFFRERIGAREYGAMAVITLSIIVLVVAG